MPNVIIANREPVKESQGIIVSVNELKIGECGELVEPSHPNYLGMVLLRTYHGLVSLDRDWETIIP